MTHEDIMNICRGLPIKKVPTGQRNLNNQHQPIMDTVQTRTKLRLLLPNTAISTKNMNRHQQTQYLSKLCSDFNITPIYKYETR
jgi:hypothetical protein